MRKIVSLAVITILFCLGMSMSVIALAKNSATMNTPANEKIEANSFFTTLGIKLWHPSLITEPENYDKNGNFDFMVSDGSNIFVSRFDYTHKSDGLGDWQLPKKYADTIIKTKKCGGISKNINSTTPYLPVYFTKNSKCAVLIKNGMAILYGIGYAHVFESENSLSDIIVVLRKNDAVVMSNLIPDIKKFDPKNQTRIDAFNKKHAQYTFPDTTWKSYSRLVDTILLKELKSKRMNVHFDALKKMALSVGSIQ